MPIESGAVTGPTGPTGPPGPSTIDLIATQGVTPPTARDYDFVIPDTVVLGQQVNYEVTFRCQNNTTQSWRKETYSVTLSITNGGTVQIDRQQVGSAINSSAPFGWSGTVVLSFSTYSVGSSRRVRISCFGPNSAPLPAGCTWKAQAIKKFNQSNLT